MSDFCKYTSISHSCTVTNKAAGLSLSGFRVGPIDPNKKVTKVGFNQEYLVDDPKD